ncbi:MAG: phage integrase SAM-like domain-containing protein [Bacteroidales bacterium]
MKLKYNIKFRIEKRKAKDGNIIIKNVPILVDFTFNRQRIKTNIGYTINVNQWDEVKQQVKRNNFNKDSISSNIINQRISEISTYLVNIYTENTSLNLPINAKVLIDVLKVKLKDAKPPEVTPEAQKNVIEYLQIFIDAESQQKNWSESTIKKINTLKKHISKYSSNLQFNEITATLLQSYIDYQRTVLNLNNTTNFKYMRLLYWFLNWATKKGYNTNLEYKSFEIKFKGVTTGDYQKNIVFLSWDELQHLNNIDFSNNKKLEQIRDIYCFCCFTSLRYSDIAHLKKNDIKTDNEDNHYLEILTVKTDDKLNIELNKYALGIWNKYKDVELKNNRAFPVPTNQKYNEYLKEVAKIAGFNSQETIIEFRGNKRIEQTLEKWELITTHTARKTFIINALYLGIQPDIIRSWTGHKDHKTMELYTKIVSTQKRISMNKFNEI